MATPSPEVDAALAALTEHLARRDGWSVPAWARKPGRYSSKRWFVTPLRGMHLLVDGIDSVRRAALNAADRNRRVSDLLEEGASAPGATRRARTDEYLTVFGLR